MEQVVLFSFFVCRQAINFDENKMFLFGKYAWKIEIKIQVVNSQTALSFTKKNQNKEKMAIVLQE